MWVVENLIVLSSSLPELWRSSEIWIAMASLTAYSASSCLLGRVDCYARHECVRVMLTSSTSRESPEWVIGCRLNYTLWRRVSARKLSTAMALEAGKETSAASGVDTQQWPIPQTIEEVIQQVTDSVHIYMQHYCNFIFSRLVQVEGRMNQSFRIRVMSVTVTDAEFLQFPLLLSH